MKKSELKALWNQYKKDNLSRWDKHDIEFFTKLYAEFLEKIGSKAKREKYLLTPEEKEWNKKVRQEIKQRRLSIAEKYKTRV